MEATIYGLEFASLDETERLSIEREFEEEEIQRHYGRLRVIRLLGLLVLLYLSFKSVGACLKGMLWLFSRIFIDIASLKNLSMPLSFV